MKCLRCLHNSAYKVADAPDGSRTWEVYACKLCCYSWRSSEEPEIINPDRRDPYFQLEDVDVEDLAITVPIPDLKENQSCS